MYELDRLKRMEKSKKAKRRVQIFLFLFNILFILNNDRRKGKKTKVIRIILRCVIKNVFKRKNYRIVCV